MVALLYFAWPAQWGGQTTWVVVKGTSMRPHYHTGDIVIARTSDHHDIGDVVVYRVPSEYLGAGHLIMHRLKAIRPDGTYVIQGDNRETPDDFIIHSTDVVGVQAVHIPKAGSLLKMLSQWWFLAGLIGAFAFVKLWPDDDEAVDDDDAIAVGAPLIPALAMPVMARPVPVVVRSRPRVMVDGDGLALARWPDARLDHSRQWAIDAADQLGQRFGTPVAMMFARDVQGLHDRPHAYVELAPENGTVADAVHAHVADRPPSLSVLVVTDLFEIADGVWSRGGSAMRCADWLRLGESVGATIR
ncbi:MAG: signal peptidase [Ilumatobacteraceae bacterium]|nr:signal peptidase [Ilumatobacteraceae bacterium]